MSDYEGQEQKDREAYYDDQWFKNMEYLEEWDDLEEEEEWDEEVNRQLDVLDQDRMARENGEKPAGEWLRADFKDLLHSYPKLRGLRTGELQALFLDYVETIDSVEYYRRVSMEQMLQNFSNDRAIWSMLAVRPGVEQQMRSAEDDEYAFYRWDMELVKLYRVARSLHTSLL